MKAAEKELNHKANNDTDYTWISGSHLYGTNTEDSDMDIRGFVFPPPPYLLNIKKFESMELPGDHIIYSAARFIELVVKGDPQATEGLFAPKKMVMKISDIGERIVSLKNDMISNKIFGRIMGYSISEWRKAISVKQVSEKRDHSKSAIIDAIREVWKPNKEIMDDIIGKLDSIGEKKKISSISGIGAKRRKDVEEYGYCRKNAAHSIRLLKQVIELLRNGTLTFPRPESDLLLGIRNGEYRKEHLEDMHAELVSEAEKSIKLSVLPNKPNIEKVWGAYYDIAMDIVRSE